MFAERPLPVALVLCMVLGMSDGIEIDWDKAEDLALALLFMTLHDGQRAWKGLDFELMDRLCERGLIGDPKGKAKSVVFTEEGLSRAREMFRKHLAK